MYQEIDRMQERVWRRRVLDRPGCSPIMVWCIECQEHVNGQVRVCACKLRLHLFSRGMSVAGSPASKRHQNSGYGVAMLHGIVLYCTVLHTVYDAPVGAIECGSLARLALHFVHKRTSHA